MNLRFINKLPIVNFVSKFILRKIKGKRSAEVNNIPKHLLKKEHTLNGSILANREQLLEVLPKQGVVAEIGVDSGDFTEKIINITNPNKLHLIDTWSYKRYGQNKFDLVKNKFSKKINSKIINISRVTSVDAASSFNDGYFDWIYIDTDHSYSTTLNELLAYEKKIKADGFILGHDYVMGNWRKSGKYGVIEAVAEFCVNRSWKLIYWTADFTENNTFAIQRIK
jgi:hypothetical protein